MSRGVRIMPVLSSLLLLASTAAAQAAGDEARPPQLVKPDAEVIPEPDPGEATVKAEEAIAREAERRQAIIDHPDTIAVVHAFVLETEPVLFTLPEEDPELGPRFDMFTRVVAEVHRSYKSGMPEQIEFWVHGGVIENPEDRIFGQPYAIFNSVDIRLEPGDEVLACLQAHWPLPDGRQVLTLRGFRNGASFPNSQIDRDRQIGLAVHDYLQNHYALAR